VGDEEDPFKFVLWKLHLAQLAYHDSTNYGMNVFL
jgi:hypothetical protein